MSESQNIEYKGSWRDEYLKWICGFANAQGGIIYIGKNDDGEIIGIENYVELMDNLPNKIRNNLGITADINLYEEKGKHFIEIKTPPYSVGVSLRGRYYYRSGSTMQELTGASLHDFLLRKSGITWDDMIDERASIDDIDVKSVEIFLRAADKAGRLPENDSSSLSLLLEKLRLSVNSKLKRASIILFGKDPGKFFPGISVKIGRFGIDDTDLKFQVVEEGNLINLLSAVLDSLNHKFLTSPIEFEGMHRIEKGEYPLSAIREMLLNALVHRNFSGIPIQIHVYDDKISIWNEGFLPEGLTLEALKRPHPSRPRNPIIADVCFKGGYIDTWGRGTLKIINACKEANLPEPEIKEQDGGLLVTLFKDILSMDNLANMGLSERQIKAVLEVKEKKFITNLGYQNLNNIGKTTATEELQQLVTKKIFVQKGKIGRGSRYVIEK